MSETERLNYIPTFFLFKYESDVYNSGSFYCIERRVSLKI